ncbi:MAG TPA: winged helix-turn-helix domain-containing protein [Rheinheimera sp.]|uniref:winged helix-turn-helix domain-containing protein n=1 Tax=Rheinheimera sp. TaxID=1869214 RepID=UPI002F9599BC
MSNLDPVVQIGDWYYQVIYGQLWPAGSPASAEQMIRLEPRLHSLLNFFLQNPDILLAKDTLIEKVWPANEGTDAAVMRAVGALRKILGDDVRTPSYIATVSKKGYCWLAKIQSVSLPVSSPATTVLPADEHQQITPFDDASTQQRPWRFIAVTALSILIGCASLAFILAKYTAAPLVKLPDTIAPISALSGQEYWPVLNAAQTQVLYQHKAPDSKLLNWSLQNLADLRVTHLPQRYQQISQALWQDEQRILFRANKPEHSCFFYSQQLQPVVTEPVSLWPCYQVLPQGTVRWQDKWLWLDNDADNQVQLWFAKPGSEASLLKTLSGSWRALQHLLISDDTLYLLAQETQNNSILLKLDLPDGDPEQVIRFPFIVSDFSWWEETQLLLAPASQELQILDINSLKWQGLGALTRDLTQTMRYPGQVLATQFLDYTTDIFQLKPKASHYSDATFLPWHVSNRSERSLAVAEQQTAFVSERAGHSQIWLEQGRDSIQLTRLNEDQQVQQLLWHDKALLVLINSELYRLEPQSSALTLYPLQPDNPGRYASCQGRLYWTELTADGWQLFTETGGEKQPIYEGAVDVRCAPEQALVLQFSNSDTLLLRSAGGTLTTLPVRIDWRKQTAEQWFVDDTGIYWQDNEHRTVNTYSWSEGALSSDSWTSAWPVAIYSGGHGIGYVVRPRPHDTDIVWLQNRR